MKQFACGDVVPGCAATFEAATDDGILAEVGRHADHDHGMSEVSEDLIAAVRAAIVTA